jgi:lipopolysaccharide transport protein LptA
LRFALFFSALLASGAFAFDSEEWLGKRELLGHEAERLRGAYLEHSRLISAPAENIAVPIETYSDGTIKSSISAKRAQLFLDTGFVWGEDVTVRQFSKGGAVESEVKAGKCIIDRNTRSGWAEGRADARHENAALKGEGIYFSFSEEFVKICTNTEIRVSGVKLDRSAFKGTQVKNDKVKDMPERTAVITAARTDYDRKEGVLFFDGAVSLDDGEYRMCSDRLYVFLDGTNELKRIVADGNVTLTNGTRSASCARAAYVKSAGRVTMYGDGSRRARLVEDSHRRDELEGRRITFWLDSEQVEVEGSTLKIEGGALGGQEKALKLMGK